MEKLMIKNVQMGVSKNNGIPKMDQNGWFIMETLLEMIWGYHYFRKHPCGARHFTSGECQMMDFYSTGVSVDVYFSCAQM